MIENILTELTAAVKDLNETLKANPLAAPKARRSSKKSTAKAKEEKEASEVQVQAPGVTMDYTTPQAPVPQVASPAPHAPAAAQPLTPPWELAQPAAQPLAQQAPSPLQPPWPSPQIAQPIQPNVPSPAPQPDPSQAFPQAETPAPTEITQNLIREGLVYLYQKTGNSEAYVDILKPFGAPSVMDLKPEHYAACYGAIRERINALKA